MKKRYTKTGLVTWMVIISLCLMHLDLSASKPAAKGKQQAAKQVQAVKTDCVMPTSKVELDVNNVRTTLLNAGDMWWNPGNGGTPKYEIPKGSGKNSMFAGGIWFGGTDANHQLHFAGQTYRQFMNGSSGATDFYAGPLDTITAEIPANRCAFYDRHYKVNCADVEKVKNGGSPTQAIIDWPGNGDPAYGEAHFLAPFVDLNGNGQYEPLAGEYPEITGDQSIWWVMNDKGNAHTKYSGLPIGLEVQAMAFAYATSDAINDMTFYKYRLINRGTTELIDTYFAQWADEDLGNAADDYIGCDVKRDLAYAYNGDGNDDGFGGYGLNPPAAGIDILSNNFGSNGQKLPMYSFMYFTNGAPDSQDDPENATEAYGYMRAFWADGTRLTYGGDGYSSGSADYTNYAFPGITDPLGKPEWSEVTESNPVGDRRTVQSVGPFTFAPGAVYDLSIGVVWAQDSTKEASIQKMLLASDKAQQLADNNFVIAGHGCNSPLSGIAHRDETSVAIYPNPTNSKAILTLSAEKPQTFEVKIYDVKGTLVRSAQVFGEQYVIEKGDLKAGIYLVSIKGEGETLQRKLVLY